MKPIEKIISRIEEFPTLSTIYNTLSQKMEDDLATATDIASIISSDQSSTIKILKAVNSPIYGLRGNVTSIDQAVVYLGYNEIKNLVLALSVIETFAGKELEEHITAKDFWSFSIATGILCRKIGISVRAKNIEEYFIAGILHCIGRLVFLNSIPDIYSKVLDEAKNSKKNTKEIEKKEIGMSHTVAAQLLFEKWRIPKVLQQAVSHQDIGICSDCDETLVASLHLAVVSCSMLNIGFTGDYKVPKLNFQIWDTVKLPDQFFTGNLDSFKREFDQTISILL
ncbi:MAG: HDOD domain-containing protein [Candidatus Kapaibacteriales bacterium]